MINLLIIDDTKWQPSIAKILRRKHPDWFVIEEGVPLGANIYCFYKKNIKRTEDKLAIIDSTWTKDRFHSSRLKVTLGKAIHDELKASKIKICYVFISESIDSVLCNIYDENRPCKRIYNILNLKDILNAYQSLPGVEILEDKIRICQIEHESISIIESFIELQIEYTLNI